MVESVLENKRGPIVSRLRHWFMWGSRCGDIIQVTSRGTLQNKLEDGGVGGKPNRRHFLIYQKHEFLKLQAA